MPFKIVKTIEKGKEKLSIIPSNWEKDGVLRWPGKNLSLKSLVKNENSKPLPDWTKIDCVVKRSSIPTYHRAEEELNVMLNHSDTSDYPNEDETLKKFTNIDFNTMASDLYTWPCILLRDSIVDYKTAEQEIVLLSDGTDTDNKENSHPRNILNALNLNNLAEECIQASKETEEGSPMVAADDASSVINMVEDSSSITHTHTDVNNIFIQDLPQDNPSVLLEIQDNMLQTDENLRLPELDQHLGPDLDQFADPQTITDSTQVPQQIGFYIENMSAIQENQKVLFQNQQNMLKGLALLNTKLDEYFTRSHGQFQQERHEQSFKMITSIEQLTDLEEQLKNQDMETKYFNELSIICSDKKTGHNNAYALVDTMFDRTFMTRCSWGGGTKGEPKHCFKAFSKTIDLFLKVVHQYDKTFTKPICEDFFKNVMRHSVKRNVAKRVRNSTTKKKVKKTAVEGNLIDENRPGPSNDSNTTQ